MELDRAPDPPPPLSGGETGPRAGDRAGGQASGGTGDRAGRKASGKAGGQADGQAGGQASGQAGRETIARRKQAAARAAAELVRDGMRVGLGTGSTVAYLLSALGERASELRGTRCVATSPATARIARELGLDVHELDELGELDVAIDGADQVDPECWLIKGGGGAHTREKIVAAAAARFVVIVSAEKEVEHLHPPVPLELLRFGAAHTLAEIGDASLRAAGDRARQASPEEVSPDEVSPDEVSPGRTSPEKTSSDQTSPEETSSGEISPDGNLLADYHGPVRDPRALAAWLSGMPGIVEHGLFAPEMVSEVLIAGPDGVRRRAGGKRSG